MPTQPTLITHYEEYSPAADTSTLTTPSFTPADGEVVVVKLTTWSTTDGMAAPTGGGQTYQAAQIAAPGGFKGWSATYVCTVAGSPGSFSISSAPATATSTRHSMIVERWGNAFVDAVPAVLATTAGSGDMLSSVTTTADDSIVTWSMCDLNSIDPAGRVYTPGSTAEDGFFDGHSGSNSVQYFAYAPEPTAGATTVGVSSPHGSLNWAASGVEVKAQTSTEVDLAATLIMNSGMTATLTAEPQMSASLAAAGNLTAAFAPVEHDLAAGLGMNGALSVTLTSVTGPPDPIASPSAGQLLACFTEQLMELPNPPAKIELRAGAEAGPLIGPNVDECCPGLAWVRVARVYPSWDSFPSEDNSWLPTGPLAYAVVLEMGVAFCMPWADTEGGYESLDPPGTQDWASAHDTLMQHQNLMRRAAACCWPHTTRRVVGGWTPLSGDGGCIGGTLTVTVSVMAPCSDC